MKIGVAPERVWAVLADPETYADWVVGSHSVRDADDSWPQVGARFYHRVGTSLLNVRDHTEVRVSEPPARLVLKAKARPLGTADVELCIAPEGDGSLVTITETAGDLFTVLAINPITDLVMNRRNVETLRRLKRIAETGIVRP
jgi:uncharacterized protein YndB with AHSA1/START domain